jgi:hypothetical protein
MLANDPHLGLAEDVMDDLSLANLSGMAYLGLRLGITQLNA